MRRLPATCARASCAILLLSGLALACGGGQTTGPDDGTSPAPQVGAVAVTTFSTGTMPDADGFTGTVAGQDFQLAVSETVVVTDIAEGSAEVDLGDVAPNCELAGSNPRSVDVAAGDTANVEFEMACSYSLVGSMVFVAGDGVNDSIVVADPDGSGSRKLYDLPNYDSYRSFTLSADGTMLVFTMADASFNFHTFVDDLTDSQDPQEVGWVAPNPAFAPDSRRVAYSSQASGTEGRIVVRDLGTGGVRELTDDVGYDQRPAWIDENNVLFDTGRGPGTERNLYRVETESRQVSPVDTADWQTSAEVVSPDGSQTVVRYPADPQRKDYRLFTLPIDGTGRTQITSDESGTQHLEPAYAPDGEWIYYVRNYPQGTEQIRRVSPDGSTDEAVQEGSGYFDVLIAPEP